MKRIKYKMYTLLSMFHWYFGNYVQSEIWADRAAEL